MNILSLLPFVQKAFEFLATNFLKKAFPGYAGLIDKSDAVLTIAVEIVSAAEATGADGASKKAKATADLLARLKALGIDLPGDKDDVICGLIIEAVVAAIKGFFKLS